MSRIFSINSLSALGLFLTACVADGATSEQPSADARDAEHVAHAASALLPGDWTSLISEETPPASCPSGYVADAMQATGRYSDNVGLHCGYIGRTADNQGWSTYFSEESGGTRVCGANQFIVGIACKRRYCDNVSIQCASFANTTQGSGCYWTNWFSEEQQYQYLSSGYAAAGLKCRGNYCDDMSIYACPVVLH